MRHGYLCKKKKKLNLRTFKSSEHINEKGDGPYRGFDYGYLCKSIHLCADFSRLPLSIMKTKIKKSLAALELENVVTRKDGYQEIINLIAKV